MCIVCQLYADSKPLALAQRTSYKPFQTKFEWNEWMTMPYAIADLPQSAMLVFTLMDIAAPERESIVGGTVLPLFGKKGYVSLLTQIPPARTAAATRLARRGGRYACPV